MNSKVRTLKKIKLSIVSLIAFSFFQQSCIETTINPFEDEVELFSIYGAIDLSNTSNIIRIKKLTEPLLQDVSSITPFDVLLSEIESDEEYQLTQEIVNFNGNYTFNYPINIPIKSNSSYKFTMIAPDGGESIAIANTPGIVIPSVDTLGTNNNGPFKFENTECTTEHEFIFSNVKEGEQLYMFSGVNYGDSTLWARTATVDKLTRIDNTDSLEALLSVRQLLFDHFPLSDDRFASLNPRIWPPTVDCDELDNNEIQIRYLHFSSDWKGLDGDEITTFFLFDSEAVKNGKGFIGGMNKGEFSYHFKIN